MAESQIDFKTSFSISGIAIRCGNQKISFYLSIMENNHEHLRFPVGRFKLPENVSTSELLEARNIIAQFPQNLENAFKALSPEMLEIPYRPEGWNSRQVIHHCADSHMNALIRFKLALTEEKPTIKPYHQAKWALLSDYQLDPAISMSLLHGIHQRWVVLMESMTEPDWKRSLVHPEYQQEQRLEQTAMLYAWHCAHHLGHVKSVM
jgi:hypothetical protein